MYGRYGFARFFSGGMIFGIILAIIVAWVFVALIRWKLFEKAGVAGWKSLIPFYGDYVEYTIVWEGKWFWFTLGAGVLASFVYLIPIIGMTILFACILFMMVIKVVYYLQKAHAFGKGDGFAVGLMVNEFVFNILLAFDDNVVYCGPQPTPGFFANMRAEAEARRAAMQQPQQPQPSYGQEGPAPRFDPYTGQPLNPQGQAPQGGYTAPQPGAYTAPQGQQGSYTAPQPEAPVEPQDPNIPQ
ncbi:MAG: hypothetical protein IJL66_05715 [Lachnospiraceae bacterium]|nr:hypothetical protein [Lachnospiraceae bacterium]